MFMLSSHYRSPINFSREQIESANASLNRLYTAQNHMAFIAEKGEDRPMNESETEFTERLKTHEKRFDESMDDDMNTADAIGAVFELVKDANVSLTEKSSKEAAQHALASLNSLCGVLGLLSKKEDDLPEEIKSMLERRAEARKNKDWKTSDELRDAIQNAGFILEDTKGGQKVRKNV